MCNLWERSSLTIAFVDTPTVCSVPPLAPNPPHFDTSTDGNFSPSHRPRHVTMVIDGTPLTIEVDGINAANTGGNFVDLVEIGFYDGIEFHRVVDDFVIQAGDPNSLSAGTAAKPVIPYTIPLEIRESSSGQYAFGFTFAQAGIPNAVPTLQNLRGTIAMARSGNASQPATDTPNTASTQFYINLSDRNTFLDGNYAVFGKVTSNLAAIDTVTLGSEITGARVTDGIFPVEPRASWTPLYSTSSPTASAKRRSSSTLNCSMMPPIRLPSPPASAPLTPPDF
ncbi:MAG: peptidylprolyl isomerase [Coleofasciculaceae cyanobacterium RL_1_1]|nr:peptidylprolyl isomerase [Coleofasciculaceae cyanobacterium RL_1_1]